MIKEKEDLEEINNMNIKTNFKKKVSLAQFTTFKIGGKAKYFIVVKNKEDLEESIKWAKKNKQKIYFFSGGSNILVNSNNIDGLVIKLENKKIEIKQEKIKCGAGIFLSELINKTTNNNLSGLEYFAGIPGSIGGAVRGNAGAFGHSISEIVEEVEVYELVSNKFKLLNKKDCCFKYRESIFKNDLKNNIIIWNVFLKLKKINNNKNIKKIILDNINNRKKQPKLPSAGCVFKNLKLKDLEKFNPDLAKEAKNEKKVKNNMVSVGWIINKLDLVGKEMGKAKISLEHANFIVNTGGATTDDVIMLISYIKQQARDIFNIQLTEEIQYFGI